MAHPWPGIALALAIFFSGFVLLRRTLVALEPRVRPALSLAVGSPLRGALTGFAVTLVIQSSSATNSVAVGLVSAGLLRLEEALALILGANVGTTFTGQLVAFGLADAGLPLIGAGLLLQVLRAPAARHAGAAAMAVGGIFYGLWALGASLSALGEGATLAKWFDAVLASDLAALGAGAALTAVVQSSSAVTGLLIALADAGSLPVRAAVAAALGSNVGTVTTTLLASLPGGPLARKAALCDLAFNALGVVMGYASLPHAPDWLAMIASTPGRRVAHAHTLFNVVTVLLALPFVRPVARWLERRARDA